MSDNACDRVLRDRTTLQAPPLLRWSSARDCPRKAVYEATNAPHRERTQREERVLARGRSVGHEYVVAIANESRRTVWVCAGSDFMLPYPDLRATDEAHAAILAELPVQWELGVGHVDGYIRDADTVLEVLSSQSASGDLIHSKLLQAGGYARALDAAAVCVAIVDPATLDDDRVIVTRGSESWDRLMGEVDDRLAELIAWRDHGTIPERVCSKPQQSFGHFCLFGGHCFEGWEPDFEGELQSEEAQRLAIELGHVKAKRRELSATDRTLEAEQKILQEQLAEFVPAGAWHVGGYRVVRSDRTRRSFNLTLAEQDSRFDGLLDQFVSTSAYSVWEVEKTGEPVIVTDEPVPF